VSDINTSPYSEKSEAKEYSFISIHVLKAKCSSIIENIITLLSCPWQLILELQHPLYQEHLDA
jgi:hypothetical protein